MYSYDDQHMPVLMFSLHFCVFVEFGFGWANAVFDVLRCISMYFYGLVLNRQMSLLSFSLRFYVFVESGPKCANAV